MPQRVIMTMDFDESDDPVEAVEKFMMRTARHGYADLTFRCIDKDTDVTVYVIDDQVYTVEEFEKILEEEREVYGDADEA